MTRGSPRLFYGAEFAVIRGSMATAGNAKTSGAPCIFGMWNRWNSLS